MWLPGEMFFHRSESGKPMRLRSPHLPRSSLIELKVVVTRWSGWSWLVSPILFTILHSLYCQRNTCFNAMDNIICPLISYGIMGILHMAFLALIPLADSQSPLYNARLAIIRCDYSVLIVKTPFINLTKKNPSKP